MKFFVALLCLVAAACANPVGWAHDGWAHNGWAHNGWAHNGWAHVSPYNSGHWGNWGHGWHGEPAHVALTHDAQYLRDTPAVSHAKASHAVAHASAAHRDWTHGWNGDHWGYGSHGYAHGYPHHYNHW